MRKRFDLHLNDFDQIPSALRKVPQINSAADHIVVPLRQVYHHLYWDSYNRNPSPYGFEHYRPLISAHDCFSFDFSNSEIETADHTQWGRAFCRWFLATFQGIPFFADVSKLESRKESLNPGFGNITVERREPHGDLPDFFCAKDVNQHFVAEAKGRGRKSPVANFHAQYFTKFREQLNRVKIMVGGSEVGLKGYIVATRMLHSTRPRARSCIAAEDPQIGPLEPPTPRGFGRWIVAQHYGRVLRRIRLLPYADAIENNMQFPEGFKLPVHLWRCRWPTLRNIKLVGGYVRRDRYAFPIRYSPLDLTGGGAYFIGIAKAQLDTLKKAVTAGVSTLDSIEKRVWENDIIPDSITVSEDGTIVGPLEFFEHETRVEL